MLKNRSPQTQPIRRRIDRSFGPASSTQSRASSGDSAGIRALEVSSAGRVMREGAVSRRQAHQWGFRLEKTDRLVLGVCADQDPGSNRDPRRSKQDRPWN